MKRTSYVMIGLGVLAALGFGLPIGAVEDAPFNTSGTAQGVSLGGNRVSVSGQGSGTHVGSFTTQTISKVKGNGDAVGIGTLTTANGDTIDYRNETSLDHDGVRRGTFTFTGGTGKFANVSGGGTIEAVFQAGGINVSRDGTISY